MSNRRYITFLAPVAATLVAAIACGEDNSSSNGQPVGTTTGPDGTGTVPGGTVPGGTVPGGTVPGGTVPGGTVPGGTVPGGTVPGGTVPGPGTAPDPSGTGTVPPSAAAMCMNTAATGLTSSGVNGATYVFAFGDSDAAACMVKSTYCIDDGGTPGNVCFRGVAAEAMSDYSCYGAGYGVQMSLNDETGTLIQSWDATAAGVAGVKFTLTGIAGGPAVRAQISIDGYGPSDAFVHGGGSKDIKMDGEQVLMFEDFIPPSWASETFETAVIDPSKFMALQIQVTTSTSAAAEYDFCMSGLTWIDAAGMPVDVTPIMPMDGAGGAGGMPGAGGAGGSTPGAGGAGGAGGAPGAGGSAAGGAPGAGGAAAGGSPGAGGAAAGGMGGMGG